MAKMSEDSTYLRYYIELLMRRLWLLVIVVIAAVLVVLILTITSPDRYQAEATIAILRSRTEVEFDPRIRTLSDDELATTDSNSRVDALVALVTSNEVTLEVLEDVSEHLSPSKRDVNSLRELVSVQTTGDLINFNVEHEDPEVAALIANRWVEHYEEFVNNVFSDNPVDNSGHTVVQVEAALQRYNDAQQALQGFIAEDPIPALQRKVELHESLLQDHSRVLAQIQGGSVKTRQALLEGYYGELQQIEDWLADARALREQVASSPNSAAANTGNAVALILLRSNVFGGELERRVTTTTSDSGTVTQSQDQSSSLALQVNIGEVVSSERVATSDVDSLIQVLEQRRSAAIGRIDSLVNSEEGRDVLAPTADGEAQVAIQIAELEGELAELRAEIETQTARRQELEQARDMSWDTYLVLRSKQLEEGIAADSPSAEVRIADIAIVPFEPMGKGFILNSLFAGTAAFMMVVGAIVLDDWWKRGAPEELSDSISALAGPATSSNHEATEVVSTPGSSQRLPDSVS